MNRITLADAKNSRIPAALGLCSTDARLLQYINEAQQRLIVEGTYWNLHARYKCNAVEGMLVWPRTVATILAASVCQTPIKVRSLWFEFVELGFGLQDECNADLVLLDRGTLPVFSPITGTSKKVKVYCDLPADSTSPVLLLGYDENQNWIRTTQGTEVLDGEVVYPSIVGTLSVKQYSVLTGVQKQITAGNVRLYEYDTTTLTQRSIAVYEYDEINPSYRVSYIPTLDTDATVDDPITVEIIAKLDYVPVAKDTDYLLIGIPALKDMCCAIQAAENEETMPGKMAAINAGLISAKSWLEAESRHYRGAPQAHLSITGSAGICGEPSLEIV